MIRFSLNNKSTFFISAIIVILIASFVLHNFVQHEHYQEHQNDKDHQHKTQTFIKAFFHGDDRKILWMLLSLISAFLGAGLFFEKEVKRPSVFLNFFEFPHFITPFREAFRRGLINPKLYS